MAAPQRRATRHPLAGKFRYEQPYMGFQSAIAIHPLQKGSRKVVHLVETRSTCREDILYDTQRNLKYAIFRRRRIARTWETKETRTGYLDLDDPRAKGPGLTSLQIVGARGEGFACLKPCCLTNFVYLLDAIVGQVGVLFDPDWYQGNWWETRAEDNRGVSAYGNFSYYGVSNFILRHPALLHSILGLFRQTILLFGQNFDEQIAGRLNRGDVEKALTEGDPELALRNLRKIRTWIEVPGSPYAYPFPTGYWGRLLQIHKATYKHGYDELFGGNIERGWNLDMKGVERHVNGAMGYWGGQQGSVAGKRLARLGR